MELLKSARGPVILRALLTTLRGVAPSLFLIGGLLGCNREFDSPLLSPSKTPVDTSPPAVIVGTTDTAKPVVVIPPKPVLIQSFVVEDLRLNAGTTKEAVVKALPADATSPRWEMSSGKPSVAEVRADGIYGKSAGTATITIQALDGSGKTARFQVIVDALLPGICVLSPCLCVGKPKEREKCEKGQDYDAD